MDILKKSLAPVTDEAWEEISAQAKKVFNNLLTARKFVDIDGPRGITYGAVSLGRLKIVAPKDKNSVNYGIHKVLPLIEVRKPFHLDIWELDNAARGADDINLEDMEEAAGEMARFEEEAIYHGFNEASIKGLRDSSAFKNVKFPDSEQDLLKLLGQLVNQFQVNA
ncbi:MAG TPA: family 1 encapsulin nanocompartment shell protein, partial [Bacteroidales bacterium]|nr:family 1 encapsulin nanocompartment shell protein [Bacteroidales bacterium]